MDTKSGTAISTATAMTVIATATTPLTTTGLPWVEKYRPTKLEEMVGNIETLQQIDAIAAKGNMPHLLLAGSPGIGKTTSATCLIRSLMQTPDKYKEWCLELNASDDRVLSVVRDKIKEFVERKAILPKGVHKVVFLDEADSMNAPSQQALRRMMELHAATSRFVFVCNDSSKIIEPLQSRCVILRFNPLADESMKARLQVVTAAEGLTCTPDALEALTFVSQGDLRVALNTLQTASASIDPVVISLDQKESTTTVSTKLLTADIIMKFVDQPHPIVLRDGLHALLQKDISTGMTKIQQLHKQGYDATTIVGALFRVVRNNINLPFCSVEQQLDCLKEIGATHVKCLEGVSTSLQLSGLVARLALIALAPYKCSL